jgi:glycosyltransferase involved in cell wall biosynthesis
MIFSTLRRDDVSRAPQKQQKNDFLSSPEKTKLVIVNQAVNYLTIDLANAFARSGVSKVALIAGSIHAQRESLSQEVSVSKIVRWRERPTWKKALSYGGAIVGIWWLLLTRYRGYDVLFLSSPPMGYLLSLFVPNRCSMLIWDLYPDTFKITGMRESHPVYRIWSWLNRRAFAKAFRVFTISEVMAEAMSAYVPRVKIIVHPIWSLFPQNERIQPAENQFIKLHDLAGKFVIQYSGNIGLTHKVEALIEIADRLLRNKDVIFQIIGRGPRLPHIQRLVESRGLGNVQLLPFQSDEMFPHSLSAANLGVVILDEKVSRGSVPSKAFNLMGFGIPSLYICSTDSQLAHYAQQFGHAVCFTEDQLDEVAEFIEDFVANPVRQRRMSAAAEQAAGHFRPSNANLFALSYLNQE